MGGATYRDRGKVHGPYLLSVSVSLSLYRLPGTLWGREDHVPKRDRIGLVRSDDEGDGGEPEMVYLRRNGDPRSNRGTG